MSPHPKIIQRLNELNINYQVREHANLGSPIRSPADFAKALGYSIERITKSLLLRGQNNLEFILAVCPANKKLDLAGIAKLLGCGRLELATRDELLEKTGYPPTGVSPIGIEGVRVVVEESLIPQETVLIGGGEVGVEVEIGPKDLVDISKAMVGKIVQ
jgi:Cys-tRNA(Pro)/Cys-tRNA(Cys) deacylase